MGDVIGDLNSRRGRIEGMEPRGNAQIITARVPLSEMFGYATSMRSMTQGRATYSMQFHSYDEVPKSLADEIVGWYQVVTRDQGKGARTPHGQAEVRADKAALEHRHDRSHRPRQDDAHGGDHEGAARSPRWVEHVSRLRLDRQGARRARAWHHDLDRARRVRDREASLRPRRLPGSRRLREEHDHGRRPDGRCDPRRLGRRRPDAADARAHPARPPGRRAVHRRRAQQGRHGRRPRAARARRARGARAAVAVRVPGRRHPGRARLGAQGARGRQGVGGQDRRADDGRRRRTCPTPSATSTSPS